MAKQKTMPIIAFVSILIFIPSLGYAQSLSELDRQLDEDNLKKINQVYVIEKKPDLNKLDCPQGAYHGLDNQGNDACRDILTNQIVDSETRIITDSGNEMITDSGRGRISDLGIGEIIPNVDQTDFVRIGILGLIGIIAAVIVVCRKKIVSGISQRRGWRKIQNELSQTKYQLQRTQYRYNRKLERLYNSLEWKIQLKRRRVAQFHLRDLLLRN